MKFCRATRAAACASVTAMFLLWPARHSSAQTIRVDARAEPFDKQLQAHRSAGRGR